MKKLYSVRGNAEKYFEAKSSDPPAIFKYTRTESLGGKHIVNMKGDGFLVRMDGGADIVIVGDDQWDRFCDFMWELVTAKKAREALMEDDEDE